MKDYTHFLNKNEITFENNDELEIICLPNWEISKIKTKFDHLNNAHSFVEMSSDQLKEYNEKIFLPLTQSASFVFYQREIEEKIYDSSQVLEFFSAKFENFEIPLIENFNRNDEVAIFKNKSY